MSLPTARPRRRPLLLAAGGLLVAVLLTAVLALAGPWVERWAGRELEARLERALDAQVEIGEVSLAPWRLGIELRDVAIDVRASGAPPLRVAAPRARLRLSWAGLLDVGTGRVRLAAAEVERPVVSVSRRFLEARARRPRPRRPLDWRIGELEVRGGRLQYEDHQMPLDLAARDVAIHGVWAPYRRALVGRLDMALAVERAPFARPWPVRVRTGFRARGRALELFGAEAEAPGASATARGRISFVEGLSVALDGHATADLAALAPWLEHPPELEGQLEGDLTLRAAQGSIAVTGPVRGTALVLGPLRAARGTAEARIVPGRLALRDLVAAAHGGRVSGRVDVDLAHDLGFDADLRGVGLSADSLLALAGIPLPVASSVDARLRMAGRPGDVQSWRGRATAVANATTGRGLIPASATGQLTIADGRVRVPSALVEAAGARFALDVDVRVGRGPTRGTIRLEGSTSDARATQVATVHLLEALGATPGETLREPLEGHGPVRARIGLGGPSDVDVALDLRQGTWGSRPFERAAVELALRQDVLVVRSLAFEGPSGGLEGALALDVRTGALDAVDIRAASLDARVLEPWVVLPIELGGRVSGALAARRQDGALSGEGTLVLEGATLAGEIVERAQARVTVRGDSVLLDELSATGPALSARGRMTIDASTGTVEIVLDEGTVLFSQLAALRGRGVVLAGRLLASGRVALTPEGPTGEILVRAVEGSFGPVGLTEIAGRVDLTPAAVVIDLAAPGTAGWSISARLGWSEDLPIDAVVEVDGARFDLAPPGSSVPSWAQLAGRARVEGRLTEPDTLHVDGLLRSLELHLGTTVLHASEPIDIRVEGGVLSASRVRLYGEGSNVEGSLRYRLGTGELDAAGDGVVDLGVLAAFAPAVRATGPLTFDLTIAGQASAPRLAGRFEVRDARARLVGFPHALEGIDAQGSLRDDAVVLEDLRAVLGGGEVVASGSARLAGLLPVAGSLEVGATSVRLSYPEGFAGVYDAMLVVSSDDEGTVLRGRVDVLRGVYTRELEVGALLGYGVREYSTSDESTLPRGVRLDVEVHAPGDVWVRNELAEIEGRFDLHLGGELARPEITGRAWLLEGGSLHFRDVEYELRQGSLDFLDLDRINPWIDLTAHTRVRDHEIVLRVEGTLDDFDYELTSTPSLSQQDLIALLLTGRTLQELTAQGSSAAGTLGSDMAANYFAGALTDRFTRQIQQMLGLERLQIDPLLVEGQADPTARVTVGKEVAEDVLLVYSTDLGAPERRLYQIEWQASRRFRLTAGRDTAGGVGGGVSYSSRLWLRRPRGRHAPAEPAGRPGQGTAATDGVTEPTGVVDDVEIRGELLGERAALLRLLPIHRGTPYRRGLLLAGRQALRRHYVLAGRIEAGVEAEAVHQGDRVQVVYRVDPGPRVDVRFDGMSGRAARRVRQRLEELWVESLPHDDLYRESGDEVRRFLHDGGFYAADVRLTQEPAGPLRDPSATRRVRFVVDRGPRVHVGSVGIEGNALVSSERIERQMLTRPGGLLRRTRLDPQTLDEDVVAIRNLYRDLGYLDAAVEPPRVSLSLDGGRADVVIVVREGSRSTVGAVTVPGALPWSEEQLREWAGLRRGDVYSPARLLAAETALRGRIDRQGHPQVRVAARARAGADHTVDVTFDVRPGPSARVGRIEIAGNDRTREKIVREQISLAPGDPLSRDALLRTQHRLYRLGIFSSVRMDYDTAAGADPAARVLRIGLQEAPPISVTVGAGYDSEAGPRGSLSIGHDNVGGASRRLAFQARQSGLERRYQIVAEEPRLFGRAIQALTNVLWEKVEEPNRFVVERRSTAVRLEHKRGPSWTRFVRYNYQRVDLLEVAPEFVRAVEELDPELIREIRDRRLEGLRLGDVSLAVVRDTRDDPFLPTRGSLASAEARVFAKPLLSDSSFVKLSARASRVAGSADGQQLVGSVRIALAQPYGSTSSVPLSERYFAGGESTLRGFPRDEVGLAFGGGEASVLANLEWRAPIWGRLKGVVFYDTGNVYRTMTDVDLSEMRNVVGAGLRVDTPIGPLRLEYGYKLDAMRDREPRESKGELFVAIGSAF